MLNESTVDVNEEFFLRRVLLREQWKEIPRICRNLPAKRTFRPAEPFDSVDWSNRAADALRCSIRRIEAEGKAKTTTTFDSIRAERNFLLTTL